MKTNTILHAMIPLLLLGVVVPLEVLFSWLNMLARGLV